MSTSDVPIVRRAEVSEARAAAELLHDFNREFGDPTPPVAALAERIVRLLEGSDTAILLAGENRTAWQFFGSAPRFGVAALSAT